MIESPREGEWHWANSYESGSVQVLLFLLLLIIMIDSMMEFVMINLIKKIYFKVSDFATIWTPNDKADNLDDCVLMKDDDG